MSASAEPEPKRRLGDFEIIRELGRGGMGIVYEARQVSLNRKVALKVLGTSLGMTSRAVVRFRREAEAAAKLHHTNIVPIYATGESDGTHFYAMELVEGPWLNLVIRHMRTAQRSESPAEPRAEPVPTSSGARAGTQAKIDAHLSEPGAQATGVPHGDCAIGRETQSTVTSPMPAWVADTMTGEATPARPAAPESTVGGSSTTLTTGGGHFDNVARMIADVADALDYAHNQGVIHRDMKPSNLLLSPDGRLSINDFGLARMLEQPGMTMTGEFVGSPLYMSPEQIAAGRAPLDHRTDIYSLGATLYELLTLQPPFPGERRDQIIAQIIQKEPKPPRRHNKKVPIDLETICLKVMEKDPDRRHQTGGRMGAHSFVRHLSVDGGLEPVWCHRCDEIFYRNGNKRTTATVSLEPDLTWDLPRQVFETDFIGTPGRSNDISADGQRLIVAKRAEPQTRTRLHTISNWFDELKRRVPTGTSQ